MLSRLPERLFRVVGALFFLAVAGVTFSQRKSYQGAWALWLLETSVYLVLAFNYARRSEALERARGWKEFVLPLFGGVLPFAFRLQPVAPLPGWAPALTLLLSGGVLLSVWGYLFLGPSFAITVEARPLRSRGPYRWVRHPVYLGQLTTFAAVALLRPAWVNAALYLLFAAVQVFRARLEEQKLTRATPGYAAYRARTWAFVPFVY